MQDGSYMTIYRYELPDGGGPFFTRNGQNRIYSNTKFNDNTLSGCDSIEHLKEWFKIRKITIPDDAIIRAYEGEIVYWNCKTNEVIIQKLDGVNLMSIKVSIHFCNCFPPVVVISF